MTTDIVERLRDADISGHGSSSALVREAADEIERLRVDNLRLVAIIARTETRYQEACQERERIRAALQSLIKIGPRPWMDGGVSWAQWDAAMSAAEAAVNIHKRSGE